MLTHIGRFQVVRQIGQGAMGAVWLAVDPMMGREVAIKSILAASSAGNEARARFEREAKAAGSLNHPNVVTIHEFGEDQGFLYLVMEFVRGEDLEGLIKTRSLSKAEFLEILAQVCDALSEAHAQGIVHRDVKPSNVRILREGGRLKAKVMDFGVAALANSDLTSDGTWMGTLNYMAPEYLDSGRAGPRSDLFAVGVMLFEALSGGRKPFPGTTPSMVLNRLLLHPAEPLAPGDIEGLSPAVAALVQKAMAKRPEDRFQNAEELSKALRAAKDPRWVGLAPAPAPSVAPDPDPMVEDEDVHSWSDEAPDPSQEVLIVSRTGQGHCLSLSVALRRAAAGTRIFVMPGVYKETLVVERPVQIIGNGKAEDIVIESEFGPCLTFRTDEGLAANLTLRAKATAEGGPVFCALDLPQGEILLEDCEFISEEAAGVVIHGAGVRPHFRRCQVKDCGGDGVLVMDGAEGLLDRCEISGVRGAGVRVSDGARTRFHLCRIHHAKNGGVVIGDRGEGVFEECNIYRNSRTGVRLEAGARSRFQGCQIHDGEEFGILAVKGGQSTFEACDIFGNKGSNLLVSTGASPLLRQCKIHDGREYGVFVTEGGLGMLEGCSIFANRLSGLVISQGGNPLLRNCELSAGMGFGVQVSDQGLGVLEGCEIRDHVMAGAKVSRGGNPMFRKCRFLKGRDLGLHFAEGALGTLDDCEVKGNVRGGLKLAKEANPTIRGGRISDGIQREGMLGMFGL